MTRGYRSGIPHPKSPVAPCLLAASREKTWDVYRSTRHLLLFLFLPLTAPAQTYRITGTLLASTDPTPIPHAQISAEADRRCPKSSPRLTPAETAPDGTFTLTLPCAATWRLTASAPNFATQSYEQHGSLSTGVVLTAAQPTYDLKFLLTPKSSITGLVLDEAGEPVRDAHVTLLDDSLEPNPSAFTRTDDRGFFEFPNLPPGTYLIAVQTQPWYAVAAGRGASTTSATPNPDPSLDLTYPITFYPDATDAASANPIHLAGGDTTETDIHLSPIPSIHLLIPIPARTDANNGFVRATNAPPIQQISPLGQTQFEPTSVVVIHNGATDALDIGGLAPGTYAVSDDANFNRRNRSERTQKIINLQKDSPRSVDLTNATESSTTQPDSPDATLKLSGYATLQSGPASGTLILLVPSADPQSHATAALQRQQTNTDGSFTFEHLRPGKYTLLAIDQGWSLNLSEPATLTTRLAHGTSITLTSSTTLPHPIEAQPTTNNQ